MARPVILFPIDRWVGRHLDRTVSRMTTVLLPGCDVRTRTSWLSRATLSVRMLELPEPGCFHRDCRLYDDRAWVRPRYLRAVPSALRKVLRSTGAANVGRRNGGSGAVAVFGVGEHHRPDFAISTPEFGSRRSRGPVTKDPPPRLVSYRLSTDDPAVSIASRPSTAFPLPGKIILGRALHRSYGLFRLLR